MSWPTGRGRRMWISMPIWAVPFAAVFWLAAWIIALVIWVIVLGVVGLARLVAMPFRKRSRTQL